MTPVTEDIKLQRGTNEHVWFKPKANVNNPTAIDLSGSTFRIDIVDITGAPLLSRTIGTPDDGIIRFDLTAEETAALPAGLASRYVVTRLVEDVTEAWIVGAINAKGIV